MVGGYRLLNLKKSNDLKSFLTIEPIHDLGGSTTDLSESKGRFLSFCTCRFGIKWSDNHGLYGLRLHSVCSCSIYGKPPYRTSLKTFRRSKAKDKIIKINRKAAFRLLFLLTFFPFAFRIVQSRNPTNLPAGRAPEPFRQEDKSERQTFKGHKTFLLRTLAQHKKLLR